MELSDGTKVQFLHIPKNAGSYVRKLYGRQLGVPHFKSFPMADTVNFAVIRDPVTRLQSIFAHAKDRYSATCNIKYFDTLDDLCKAYYNPLHPYHEQAARMFDWNWYKLSHSFTMGARPGEWVDSDGSLIHFAPQYLYVCNRPEKCEYLLRFEHLDEDLESLVAQKKLPSILKKSNRSKQNVSSTTSKQLAYITPCVRSLVHHVYARDIELHNSLTNKP